MCLWHDRDRPRSSSTLRSNYIVEGNQGLYGPKIEISVPNVICKSSLMDSFINQCLEDSLEK